MVGVVCQSSASARAVSSPAPTGALRRVLCPTTASPAARTIAVRNPQRRGFQLLAAAQAGQMQQSTEWSEQWMALNEAQ
eukprot:scaffold526768_cov38-Prasinocladus_malaysianus.AAC.1